MTTTTSCGRCADYSGAGGYNPGALEPGPLSWSNDLSCGSGRASERESVMKMSIVPMALCLAAVAWLSGCAGAGPSPEQEARETAKRETIQDILTQPMAAEEYGEQQRCLSSLDYDNVDVLDAEHVLFRGRGDNLWLNKLRNRCVGLDRNDVLRFRMRSNQLCDMDTFEGLSSFMVGVSSGNCSLGTFTRVTPDQVEAIEHAVKEARGR